MLGFEGKVLRHSLLLGEADSTVMLDDWNIHLPSNQCCHVLPAVKNKECVVWPFDRIDFLTFNMGIKLSCFIMPI